MKASMRSNGLALATFAAICAGVVALVNHFTKDTIAQQRELLLLNTLNTILVADSYNNALLEDCILLTEPQHLGSDRPHKLYRARLNQQNVALVVETTAPDGYSGSIDMLMAIHTDGRVSGVKVLNHRETPGLGDKIDARKSDWINRFDGLKVQGPKDKRWAVKKDHGIFDQFTGATITPRAVVKAVKNTALFLADQQQRLFALPSTCGPITASHTPAQSNSEVTSDE